MRTVRKRWIAAVILVLGVGVLIVLFARPASPSSPITFGAPTNYYNTWSGIEARFNITNVSPYPLYIGANGRLRCKTGSAWTTNAIPPLPILSVLRSGRSQTERAILPPETTQFEIGYTFNEPSPRQRAIAFAKNNPRIYRVYERFFSSVSGPQKEYWSQIFDVPAHIPTRAPAASRPLVVKPPGNQVINSTAILQMARQAVTVNDTWLDKADFESPKQEDDGSWTVLVWRLPRTPGGFRLIKISVDGKLLAYIRGE